MRKTIVSDLSPLNTDYKKIAACFIGPNGENEDLLTKLITEAIQTHLDFRKHYYDGFDNVAPYITEDIKNSKEYQQQKKLLEKCQNELIHKLKGCAPFSSWRYQGHMEWDLVLPGVVGYFTAMLYNQNNVATEASPVTSILEVEVGKQLAQMLGFDEDNSWGHITADGTIANIEAMWSARNLRLYPLAVHDALTDALTGKSKRINELVKASKELKITINNVEQLFIDLTDWELFNLSTEIIFSIPAKIKEICFHKVDKADLSYNFINTYICDYLVQAKGMAAFSVLHPIVASMVIFVPANHHYSWTKAAGLLGLGQNSIIKVPINSQCQMSIDTLKSKIDICLINKTPILLTVAVMGSTAEGAVDGLKEIIENRDENLKLGLYYNVHCDAAWGGYMTTLLKEDKFKNLKETQNKTLDEFVPLLPLSNYAKEQLEHIKYADSATVDPHKAGFIPYPSGSLCYKNAMQRYFISNDADYIHSDEKAKIGVYGIEGSKPGAAAAAVWLTNKVIPLNQSGYGQILGECNYSTKLYYCYWITLAEPTDNFDIQSLVPLPNEIYDKNSNEVIATGEQQIRELIKNHIIGKTNEQISKDNVAMSILQEVGSDVLINTFVVNYKTNDGSKIIYNKNLSILNNINKKLFTKFSIQEPIYEWKNAPKYILTSTEQNYKNYKSAFDNFGKTWELELSDDSNITFLINTIMQPWPNTLEIINLVMNIFRNGINEVITELELVKHK